MNTQTTVSQKNYKKECLLQDLQIVLWGVLALVLIVLTVLELLPASVSDLTVEEPFSVSSSLIDVSNQTYVSAVTGTVANTGGEQITVDSVRITVSNGRVSKDIEIEGFVLPPRTEQELSEGWTGNIDFDRITRILVTVDGQDDVIANVSSSIAVSGIAIFYLIVLIPIAILLVRACKVRYYIYQDMKMR